MNFQDKVKERYFQLKAKRCCMDAERVRTQCKNRLPSDQVTALVEVLTETLGLDDISEMDFKKLNISLED